jgi:hypothetical protein
MDPVTLAAAAVAVLAPYFAKAGEEAAKKIGEEAVEAGGKLLGWMHARLGGRAKDALDDLVAGPGSKDNQADLRKQLVKVLEADPALAADLRAMLPADATGSDSMSQNVSGAGAKAAQMKGSGNTILMG